MKTNNSAKQTTLYKVEANGKSEECYSRNGICSHDVLRDGNPHSDSKMLRKVFCKFLIEAKYVIMINFVAAGFPIGILKYFSLMYMCGLHMRSPFIDVCRTQTSIRLNRSLCRTAQAVEPYVIKNNREISVDKCRCYLPIQYYIVITIELYASLSDDCASTIVF